MSDAPEAARAAMTAAPAAAPDEFVFVARMELGGRGPRVAVKDSIDIAGFPTRMGSACYAEAPPAAQHAAVVRALLEAGCRIVGKTNLHELAYGLTGINAWSGTPANPRAPGRVPGGSSSGSAAAVAARLVDFSLATDTGGSIRLPAACCGVCGLKPSFGRVDRSGVHPARSTLDCVGPLAVSVAMIERAMTIIDPSFRPEDPPRQPSVGWVEVEARAEVAAAARAALAAAQVRVRAVSLPSFAAAFAAGLTILGSENWAAFGHLAGSERLGADVRTRLLAAQSISAAELAAAESVRRVFSGEVDAALAHVEALALPTLPDFPLTLAAAAVPQAALGSSALVRPFNLSGHPALTLPIAAQGLPVGLQLIGRAGGDEALCALARTLAHRASQEERGGVG
jgi:amidase